MGSAYYRKYWDDIKKAREKAKADGRVIIRCEKERLQVVAPFHPEFQRRAKDLGGRWRYRTGFWSFPWSNRRSVLDLLRELYGAEAMGQWGTFHD